MTRGAIVQEMQRAIGRGEGGGNYLMACAITAERLLDEQHATLRETIETGTLTFAEVIMTNAARCDAWHSEGERWTGADWSNAMGGECGEAQNVVKKLRRSETGTGSTNNAPDPELLEQLGNELADTFIYLLLLADHYKIDFTSALVRKFNAVSEREGFTQYKLRSEATQ